MQTGSGFFGILFLSGFLGSLGHCLGMCGPLVMAYSLHIRPGDPSRQLPLKAIWAGGIAHHLAFHAGRILTYGLLGALAACVVHLTAFNQVLGNGCAINTNKRLAFPFTFFINFTSY